MLSDALKKTLKTAVDCDMEGRIFEALDLYESGARDLMEVATAERDELQRKKFFKRLQEYVNRVEQIKINVKLQISKGKAIAKIHIPKNAYNSSYAAILGSYLTPDLKEIILEEPRLSETWEIQNLTNLLEAVMDKCPDLKYIRVNTNLAEDEDEQLDTFECLKKDLNELKKGQVVLTFVVDNTRLDPKVILNTGYVIKIEKGMHYFKYPKQVFNLGLFDYDFRQCHETKVQIYFTKPFHA